MDRKLECDCNNRVEKGDKGRGEGKEEETEVKDGEREDERKINARS